MHLSKNPSHNIMTSHGHKTETLSPPHAAPARTAAQRQKVSARQGTPLSNTYATNTRKPKIFKPKTTTNVGSKDPLKPPSETELYCLFSGTPIIYLRKRGTNAKQRAMRNKARALAPPQVVICGEHKGKENWKKLHKTEGTIMASGSDFGHALAILKLRTPSAPIVHTNLHLPTWLAELSNLNTIEAADCYYGLSRGMELLPESLKRPDTETPNYFKSEHAEHVDFEIKRVLKDQHLAKYSDLRKIWPSLPETPHDRLGLGFVLKIKVCDTTGKEKFKRRLIIDASRPSRPVNNSVNRHIPEAATTLPTTAQFASHAHRDDWFAAADIADAFMNLGLKPHNWANVSINICLDGTNADLAYCRLAFGLRSAVRIFQGVAELILRILRVRCTDIKHLIRFDMSYIDDSACVAATKAAAAKWLKNWKILMLDLGMPWQESKIVPPTKLIELLGIMVCSRTLTMFVHESRVQKALQLMQTFERSNGLTLKQVQSIMGHLNFIAQVVRFARLFLRGLAIMIKELNASFRQRGLLPGPNSRMQLTRRVKIDFAIWRALLITFNGIDVAAPTSYPALKCGPAQCDASFYGAGFFMQGVHGHVKWSRDEIFDAHGKAKVSTAYVEAKGLLFLLQSLAPYWAGKYVHIHLDNHALVGMMLGERTKSEQVLPIIVDCLAIIVAYAVKPKFTPIGTDDMIFADPLSRLAHPGKEAYYKSLFDRERKKFSTTHPTWIKGQPAEPSCPAALKLPEVWKSMLSHSD